MLQRIVRATIIHGARQLAANNSNPNVGIQFVRCQLTGFVNRHIILSC